VRVSRRVPPAEAPLAHDWVARNRARFLACKVSFALLALVFDYKSRDVDAKRYEALTESARSKLIRFVKPEMMHGSSDRLNRKKDFRGRRVSS